MDQMAILSLKKLFLKEKAALGISIKETELCSICNNLWYGMVVALLGHSAA